MLIANTFQRGLFSVCGYVVGTSLGVIAAVPEAGNAKWCSQMVSEKPLASGGRFPQSLRSFGVSTREGAGLLSVLTAGHGRDALQSHVHGRDTAANAAALPAPALGTDGPCQQPKAAAS